MSRSAHYRAKNKHAQRQFGEAKAKLAPRDTDTIWIPEFVASMEGLPTGAILTINSDLVLPLGENGDEREKRLRELSRRGILRMQVVRQDGVFVRYQWCR